jgi:hypothetical protein
MILAKINKIQPKYSKIYNNKISRIQVKMQNPQEILSTSINIIFKRNLIILNNNKQKNQYILINNKICVMILINQRN